ncbi:bacteriophage host specificity protein [Pseudomonas chlororaphis subsp. aurantiaca]|uniref:hypothetical protein n=1 Tax=Pseudomonas chlororaphis TaxID=587753 RepID=UPI0008653873|nr:hypothetical protein [Pseudomonas chlororaphis]BAV74185.1 bacteriophage host specificity protein [Pseudomonas chlororaphis subsp. aurantiaca]
MKSEYRQVVESIISQKAKLAEVKKMHDGALARVAQTAEWVKFNEASLKKYEDRLAEIESGSASDQPKPFIVIDGVTYISEAEVERASIACAKLGDDWKVKTVLLNGKYVATGIGLSPESQFLVNADRWAINGSAGNTPQPGDALKAGGVTSMLDVMASTINETSLGKDLLSEINKPQAIAEQIRDVLRAELRPGGILHLR